MVAATARVDIVLDGLDKVRQTSTGWTARCPAHDDQHPSLSIGVGQDGRVLLRCHAGCDTSTVLAALRLSFADLDEPRDLFIQGADRDEEPQVTTYDYCDEDGELLYQVVRQQYVDRKEFYQRKPTTGGAWDHKLGDVPRVLYRLPELLSSSVDDVVLLLEGEKDVDCAAEVGHHATTNAGGAGKWRPEYNESLRDRHVVLIPDNDQPGYRHMLDVARSLEGTAASITIIRLRAVDPKGDLSDFLDAGAKWDDLDSLIVGTRSRIFGAELIDISELTMLADGNDGFAGLRNKDNLKNEDVLPSLKRPIPTSDAAPLRFRSAAEIAAATPERPDWIACPWVVAGSITELVGKIKAAGKTTFVTHLCRSVLDGAPFMGRPTRRSPVVYLTEQPAASFREALRRAGLLDRDDCRVLFWHEAHGVSWPDVVAAAVTEAKRVDARLLVVDTLGQFAGIRGDAENNAGEAMAAIEPLQRAAAAELGVVVLRHERKSGGDVGESGRGSSAFAGAVDIVLRLKRGDGNTRGSIRVIDTLSRFDETPETLVIDLTEAGYVGLGDEPALALHEAKAAIMAAAPETEAGAVATDPLIEAAKVKPTVGKEALKQLAEHGALARTGGGKKGSPYRYWRPTVAGNDSAATPVVAADPNDTAVPLQDTPPLIHSAAARGQVAAETFTPLLPSDETIAADEVFPASQANSIHSAATSALRAAETIPASELEEYLV